MRNDHLASRPTAGWLSLGVAGRSVERGVEREHSAVAAKQPVAVAVGGGGDGDTAGTVLPVTSNVARVYPFQVELSAEATSLTYSPSEVVDPH